MPVCTAMGSATCDVRRSLRVSAVRRGVSVSRMLEICTSGSMRGSGLTSRSLLDRSPRLTCFFRLLHGPRSTKRGDFAFPEAGFHQHLVGVFPEKRRAAAHVGWCRAQLDRGAQGFE